MPQDFDEQINHARRHDDWRDERYLFWRRVLFYTGLGIFLAMLYIAAHI